MSANRAQVIQGLDAGRSETLSSLRLAETENRTDSRLHQLADLATHLMKEARALASDRAFVDESPKLHNFDLSSGIDFYSEVQRFETALIKLALERAAGNQAQAARLLGLRATTLNSKIKIYNIEF